MYLDLLSEREDGGYEFDAARWRRNYVIGFGFEQWRRECMLIKAKFRR